MLGRVVVPPRLALICRGEETLGYNPALNLWERLDRDTAEAIRWLRAGRDRNRLAAHLEQRFGYSAAVAADRLQAILKWCILRRLLYLDRLPDLPGLAAPADPLGAVYWVCTQACNLRCTYCYQSAARARPGELSTAEGKYLVDQVVEAGAKTLVFTGGEPFTRKDLLEIARYSRQCGLRTNVISNGHYITKNNVRDVAAAFHNITISLDHGVPAHHDCNRGQGSWIRTVRAIDLLVQAGATLDINSVLSRFGLTDVAELLRFVRQRHVRLHRIIPQFPLGRGACARGSELTPADLLQLNDLLFRANQALADAATPEIRPEGRYSSKLTRRNHCGAGVSEVSIDPEGWVYPCKLLQLPEFRTDNIRTRRLAEIVGDHPQLAYLRGRVADTLATCPTCIIKNHCGGGCRAIHTAFSGEYTRSHPLFCAYLRRTFEVQAWAHTGEVPPARPARFQAAEEAGATPEEEP